MIGYKVFNKDLICNGIQYEIGKTYSITGSPIPHNRGFHFCKSIRELYRYYSISDDVRICEIEALGVIRSNDGEKYCTNIIKIIKEITFECESDSDLKLNNNECGNSGDPNSGNRNSGDGNSGYFNSGSNNSGIRNIGCWNSGSNNYGYWNSGGNNLGSSNSGYWNSGDYNSGDWNSGNCSSGLFNTEKNPKIKIFDKESDWTIEDWYCSKAMKIMDTCPRTYSNFIEDFNMTDDEKKAHPEYKTLGGYVKIFVASKKDKEKWWNELSEADKDVIKKLPNFDLDKFKQCVGF